MYTLNTSNTTILLLLQRNSCHTLASSYSCFSLCFSSFNLTEAGFLDGVFLKVPSPEQGLAKCQEWRSCESMMPMPMLHAFHFLQISWESRKDMEGSMKLWVNNTSKCCIAANKKIKAKIQHERMPKNVNERDSELTRFLSFFHPECGTHRTAPDRNEKSLAPRVWSKTDVSTRSATSSRFSRVVSVEAPRHRLFRLLKVSDLQKNAMSNDRFSCEQILLNLLQCKKIYKLKVVVPKIYIVWQ